MSQHVTRALAAWDVVCVQESFLPYITTVLDEIAHETRMHLWCDRVAPGEGSRSVFGGGLAILSRTPPLGVRFIPFDGRSHGLDGFARKGYAVADFQTPGGARYRVINTHLQADDPLFGIEPSQQVRADQLRVLMGALESDIPTIIAGDLNVPYGSTDYARHLAPLLVHRGIRDHAETSGLVTYDPVTNDLLRAMGPKEPRSRLDYILTTAGDRWAWFERSPARLFLHEPLDEPLGEGRGQMFASDHYGLGVGLVLAEATAS